VSGYVEKKLNHPLLSAPIETAALFLPLVPGYNSGMSVSHSVLRLLALFTWITGGVVLFLKGFALFTEADGLLPGAVLNYLPFAVAVVVGGLKARWLFLPSCRKNLTRISSLANPKLWQFFRPGFFIFLLCMVLLGVWLSGWASGSYLKLLAVASVDLTLSVALLGSLVGFGERKRIKEGRGAGRSAKGRDEGITLRPSSKQGRRRS